MPVILLLPPLMVDIERWQLMNIDPEFINDWGDEEKEDEEEDIEEKEDDIEEKENDGGSGSDDEDFHDY